MSAQVLLNLLNELGERERDTMRGLPTFIAFLQPV